MAVFDDIELEWAGVTYRLQGDGEVMRALAAVEDHVTLAEVIEGQQTGHLPLAKLAAAYACLLRHAGARTVQDAEVYAGMFRNTDDGAAISAAVTSLLELMMPPSALEQAEADEPGKADPAPGGTDSSSAAPTRSG